MELEIGDRDSHLQTASLRLLSLLNGTEDAVRAFPPVRARACLVPG